MPIPVPIIYGCLCTVMTMLRNFTQTIGLAKSKIFSVWAFAEKACPPLVLA